MSPRVVRSNFRGLDQLVRTIGDGSVVKVGILAKKTSRHEAGKLAKGGGHKVDRKSQSDLTNAEIGAVHEFGSLVNGTPKRSWLRMPIFRKAGQIVKEAAEYLPKAVEAGSMKMVLKRIGVSCEKAIQEAFETRGFGSWKPLSASTVSAKKSSAPLIDTAQLRRSVTSAVEKPS